MTRTPWPNQTTTATKTAAKHGVVPAVELILEIQKTHVETAASAVRPGAARRQVGLYPCSVYCADERSPFNPSATRRPRPKDGRHPRQKPQPTSAQLLANDAPSRRHRTQHRGIRSSFGPRSHARLALQSERNPRALLASPPREDSRLCRSSLIGKLRSSCT